ncbi:hypothetical protein MG290_08375 [Flavobacterium sp. CBA20B-1]|nr:RHS repeat-associated core domain-containing protein [Flavobacterium sp. CBA20B-1]WCM40978.1 hypothetical protein MG290_08375 [Flavobacterium sp. CBA20B-1]
MPGDGYKYKFLNKEYEDSFVLNVTETDYRHYDSALGRFNVIDPLAELAPDFTPYRYGFNNPVLFSDPSGLFETWYSARSYQLSRGLFGSIIDYDWDNDYWYIESNGSRISQLGDKILKIYEMDGEWIMDSTESAGGGNGGGDVGSKSSSSKKSEAGFWKFWETGGMFNVYGVMRDMPGFKPNSRKRSAVDVSMNYDQVISPAMGSSWLERLKDLLGGLDTRSSTLWERLNKTETNDKDTEAKEFFSYETYGFIPSTWENRFILVPTTRSVHMTPTDFNNTDWNQQKIYDSIKAVEVIKTNDITKYYK